jgi:hypothetical protein
MHLSLLILLTHGGDGVDRCSIPCVIAPPADCNGIFAAAAASLSQDVVTAAEARGRTQDPAATATELLVALEQTEQRVPPLSDSEEHPRQG